MLGYGYFPEDRFWRLLPYAFVTLSSLWGMIWPQLHWRLMWGWHHRYRDITDPDERARLVRRSLIAPLIVGVVAVIVLWPQR